MRLILGTALAAALAMSGAYAQGNTTMDVTGSKAFCLKMAGGKVNCGFDTLAACQKETGKGAGSAAGAQNDSTCLPRSQVR
jgi:hypothetical protein